MHIILRVSFSLLCLSLAGCTTLTDDINYMAGGDGRVHTFPRRIVDSGRHVTYESRQMRSGHDSVGNDKYYTRLSRTQNGRSSYTDYPGTTESMAVSPNGNSIVLIQNTGQGSELLAPDANTPACGENRLWFPRFQVFVIDANTMQVRHTWQMNDPQCGSGHLAPQEIGLADIDANEDVLVVNYRLTCKPSRPGTREIVTVWSLATGQMVAAHDVPRPPNSCVGDDLDLRLSPDGRYVALYAHSLGCPTEWDLIWPFGARTFDWLVIWQMGRPEPILFVPDISAARRDATPPPTAGTDTRPAAAILPWGSRNISWVKVGDSCAVKLPDGSVFVPPGQ